MGKDLNRNDLNGVFLRRAAPFYAAKQCLIKEAIAVGESQSCCLSACYD